MKEQSPYIGLHCHCNLWLQLARHTWVKLLWLSLQAKYQKQASNHLQLKNNEPMKHYISTYLLSIKKFQASLFIRLLIVDLYLWCADPASACYSDILSFESTNRKCETFKVTALHCCFLKSHFL